MAKILYEPNENEITKEEYIEKVIKQEIELPEVKISSSNVYLSSMMQVIEYYCKKYGNSIDELPWKIPKVINENYTSNWISDIVIEKFSLDELEIYIKDVVRKSVNEYIIFIYEKRNNNRFLIIKRPRWQIWKITGGLDEYFFHSLEANNSGKNKYFVIKNLIYNYLESDFKKIEEYFKHEN